MRLELIAFLILFTLCYVKSLLVKLQERCVPTLTVRGPCHVCVCDADGVFICQPLSCPKTRVNPRKSFKGECQKHVTYRFKELFCSCNYDGRWMSFNCRETFQILKPDRAVVKSNLRSNLTSTTPHPDFGDLPEIQDGQSCIPEKWYKMSCNTCLCGNNNELICTKMACFENALLKELREEKNDVKININSNMDKNKQFFKKSSQIQNKARKKVGRAGKQNKDYPILPRGNCKPGRIYRSGCKKCFCSDKKKAVCTVTCSGSFPTKFSHKEMSAMEPRSMLDLPELPHMGSKCDPGRSYYVDCNVCFCSHRHDLFCTLKYCLSFPSYSEVHAKEITGHKCTKDFKLLCSDCKCVNNKAECKAIPNCSKKMHGKTLLSSAVGTELKLSLDIKKDKCKPNVTYKVHCNDCYCQPDGSLRCTQKICLTYSQTMDLQQREADIDK